MLDRLNKTVRVVELSLRGTFVKSVICLITITKRRKFFTVKVVEFVELGDVTTFSIVILAGVACQLASREIIHAFRTNSNKIVLFVWKTCILQQYMLTF